MRQVIFSEKRWSERKNKIYPKIWNDTSWLKFFFDYQWTHFTMRFSGNPLIILEEIYTSLGWTDFVNVYECAKQWKVTAHQATLKDAIKHTQFYLEILQSIWARWKSPFVVYPNDQI